MFGREKPKTEFQPQPVAEEPRAMPQIESVIGPKTHVKGEIHGDGGLRIEGVVEGTVNLTGNLIITESAKVFAEIKANNVSISGAVVGNISANRVEILETGRLWGDVMTKQLVTAEGAYFDGRSGMVQKVQPPQLEAQKPKAAAAPKPAETESAAEKKGAA